MNIGSTRRKSLLTSTALGPAITAFAAASFAATPAIVQAQDRTIDGGGNETIEGDDIIVPRLLIVGNTGQGTLNIINGGSLETPFATQVGFAGGSAGVVTVTSQGSRFESREIVVGSSGTGSLTIADGGFVRSDLGSVGVGPGSTGTVLVTGPNSRWDNSFSLRVGFSGSGSLTIADGGTVRSGSVELGSELGSTGTVLVTGANSLWDNTTNFRIGGDGAATLTIADDGVVRSSSIVIGDIFGNGILNFGAAEGSAAVAAGTLDTSAITFRNNLVGASTSTMVFNHTDSDFALAAVISGPGALRQLAGTTTLTGGNTFSGLTEIRGGTLALGANTALSGSSPITITGGTLALSSFSGTAASVNMSGGAITGPGTLGVTGNYVQSGGTLGVGATVSVGGTRTLRGGAIDGTLAGPGDTTVGPGTTNLSGTISGGITTVVNGGVLRLTGNSNVGNISFDGGELTASTNATLTGTAVGPRETNQSGTISAANGATLTIATNFFIRGPGGIGTTTTFGSEGNAGTVVLNNRFSGNLSNDAAVIISEGIVRIGNVTSGAASFENIDGQRTGVTTTVNATLDINGFATNVANLRGSGIIVNDGISNATLNLQTDQSNTFAGVIRDGVGAISVVKAQGGTQVFTGDQGYSGTTTISAGTLQIGSGGATGSLGSGNVVNNAALVFNRSDDLSIANAISGTGTLIKQGIGNLTLTSANTYSGQTLVTQGTLTVANSTALGTVAGNTIVSDGATLALEGVGVNISENILLNGNGINGNGALRHVSAGAASALLGQITLQSSSQINSEAGRLSIFAGLNGENQDLIIDGQGTTIIASKIDLGLGNITKNGSGLLAFFRGNAQLENIIINSGSVQLGERSNPENDAFTDTVDVILNGGSLLIARSETVGSLSGGLGGTIRDLDIGTTLTVGGNNTSSLFAGVLDQTVALTKEGSGTLTLAGENNNSGVTTVNAGTLQIGSGGTVGSLGSGNVVNNAALVFNRSTDLTVANIISGSGALTKLGAGKLTLTGANTYSGTTTINAGTLQIGNGGTTGALGTGSIVNNAALVFNRSNDFTVASAISGTGSLTKLGAGTLTLTGVNTYSGATIVNAGTLALGANNVISTASALDINDSAFALNGFSGTVASVDLSGGEITGPGTLAVTGNYFQSGGTLGAGAVVNVGMESVIRLSGGTIAGTLNGLRIVGVAGTIDDGSVLVTGALDLAANLDVGDVGMGALTISAGGVVKNRFARLGASADGVGTVTVTGAGSQWINTSVVAVGAEEDGTGNLVIADGGKVTNSTGSIANGLRSTGTVTVTGKGSEWVNSSMMLVGSQGAGSLTISDGGIVRNTTADIGFSTGSTGSVTVTGQGSQWISSSQLTVGTESTGSLIVSDGGFVRSAFAFVGAAVGVSGAVTVTGAGSEWLSLSGLTVGGEGLGTLTITDGGLVRSLDGLVGGLARSNGTATVTGEGGRWMVSNAITVGGESGPGTLTIADGGSVSANSTNVAFGSTSTGTLNFGAAAADTAIAAGQLTTQSIAFGAGTGTIVFNHTDDDFALAAAISGNGTLRQLAGTTILSGASAGFTGTTTVTGGNLQVNGTLGGSVTVTGGTLSGAGTLGDVIIGSGGALAAGQSPGTMTVANLGLRADSTTVFELGEADVVGGANNDLIRVTGALTIEGGTIEIAQGAGFGAGQYTLFEFGTLIGALESLTLDPLVNGFRGILALGEGEMGLRTVVLNAAAAADLVWWNGATTSSTGMVEGGDGVWSLAGNNFTDANGNVSGPWGGNGAMAVFGGAAGTVTIAADTVLSPGGLSFLTDGYVITGGNAASGLSLGGPTGIDTLADVGATIAVDITGAGSLTKTGAGTLTLSGDNTSAGGTFILGGTLANAGIIAGAVDVLGGTLNNFTGAGIGGVTTVDVGGTLNNAGMLSNDVTNRGLLTSSGVIAGTLRNSGTANIEGALDGVVINNGAILLTGITSGINGLSQNATGVFDLAGFDTTIDLLAGGGSILLSDSLLTTGSNLGNPGVSVVATEFSGVISGSGGLAKVGSSTLVLTGNNTYTGGTTISSGAPINGTGTGVLQLGDGGTTGSITGPVVNNASLSVNRSDDFTFDSMISGTGAFFMLGTGTTTLTGDNRYTGSTTILSGALQIGNGGTTGTLGIGDVLNNAALVFNRSDGLTVANTISGTGTLTKLGDGTLTLSGANTFTGGVALEVGSLLITGSLASQVTVNGGILGGNGTLGAVTINSGGTLAAGQSPGTMNLDALTLNAGSVTEFELGEAGVVGGAMNDLYRVAGNLALNGGVFRVLRGDAFASGQYTLFEFASLSGDLGNMMIDPLGGGFVSNLALGEGEMGVRTVLLNASAAADLVWWNGSTVSPTGMVEGGDGTWSLGGGNFTNADGTVDGVWAGNGALAVFGGTAGRVTIAPGEVLSPSGLSFVTDGYVITGGDAASGLALTGPTGIDTAFGVGATIDAVISGTGSLTVTGEGTLTLTADNTYTGATSLLGGTLANAGGIAGAVEVFGGTFNNLEGAEVGGVATIGSGGRLNNAGTLSRQVDNSGILISTGSLGTLDNNAGGIASLSGDSGEIENSGTITVVGDLNAGDTVDNSASGLLTINSGAALFAANTVSNSGTAANAFAINGTLINSVFFDNFGGGQATIGASGTLNGTGSVRNRDSATLTNAGTIAIAVDNGATLNSTGALLSGLTNSGVANIAGQLLGAVSNSGTINLTGMTTGIGAVTQTASGSFNLGGFSTSIGSLAGSGAMNLGAGTVTLGGDGSSTSFAGVISGSGGLIKTGSGRFTLAGINTYTGETRVDAGTLVLAAGGQIVGAVRNGATFTNAGTVSGAVTNSGDVTSTGTIAGALTNDVGGTVSLSGVMSGPILNSGLITLTGATTGIGAVSQMDTGSFDLAGFDTTFGNLAGSGTIALGSGSLTVGADNSSSTFDGVIGGAGGVVKVGTGTFTVTGANTYTGTTLVDAGTLVIGEAQAAGEAAAQIMPTATVTGLARAVIAGDIGNNATLINNGTILGEVLNSYDASATNHGLIAGTVFNDGTLTSTGTLGGGLTNNGTALIAGMLEGDTRNTGTLTLTGTMTGMDTFEQTATGVLDLAGFDTTIGAITGAGSIALGDATLSTGSDDIVTLFGGVIAGTGALNKVGTGQLVLTGSNTFSGGTTITGGALQLGNGGTSGAIIGPVVNNGALVVNRSDAYTFAGMISGTGVFVQDGTGTTTLTGANSYTGGTFVNRGRLVGDTASLQGAIRNDAALEFALGADGTFAGMLMGSGLTEKTGAGVLTFAGDGRLLTGPFAVLGGGLRLDGRLDQSVVTLASGTTLSGNGMIGGLVVESGALVTPGTSLGMIGVAGDVTFMDGSRYLAEVSELGADLISTTGTAQLAGAIDIVNIGGAGYAFNSTFTVLEAEGGISGSFDAVSFNGFSAIYRPTLRSNANGLELVLAPNSLATLAGAGLSGNQAAVAARFDAAVEAGFSPQPFINLYNLAPADLTGALDQLSGEIHPAMGRAAMRQSRLPREAVLERAAGAASAETEGTSWGGWGKVMRSWGDVDGDGSAAPQDTDTEGFMVGFDGGTANDTRTFRAGFYGSYLDTRIQIDARRSSGRLEQTGGGVYASLALGGLSLAVGGGAAHFDITTQRTVALPGLADATTTASTGDMAQVFGRLGYSFDLGAASIEPFVAGDHAWIALDQTVETGGDAALSVGWQEYKVAGATAGIAAKLPIGKLRIESELAARFELGDQAPEALIALAAAPGQATRIAATRLNDTAYSGRIGAVLSLAKRIEVRVDYSGQFSGNDTEHAALAGVRIAF